MIVGMVPVTSVVSCNLVKGVTLEFRLKFQTPDSWLGLWCHAFQKVLGHVCHMSLTAMGAEGCPGIPVVALPFRVTQVGSGDLTELGVKMGC